MGEPQENEIRSSEPGILFAQQPILDVAQKIVAYELLFRGDFDQTSGSRASATVFSNAFSDNRFDQKGADVPLFVNFTRELLFNVPPFDKDKFVVEVLEDVEPTPEVVAQLRKLKQQGYTIALDDFEYSDAMIPLLAQADIVKLDVMAVDKKRIAQWVPMLRQYNAKLLAEKVETHAEFDTYKQMGFEYYQGFFFARPQHVEGREVGPDRASVLAIIAALQDPEVDGKSLESIISGDSGLTYKVIQLVNSAAYRRVVAVDSVRVAIVRLGVERIRSLATLLALSGLSAKPAELQRYVTYRSLLCDRLGAQTSVDITPETFQTVGIISCCDAYFDAPLESLLPALPLSESVKCAILEGSGPMGTVLDAARKLQELHWDNLNWGDLQKVGLCKDVVAEVYRETSIWADSTQQVEIW